MGGWIDPLADLIPPYTRPAGYGAAKESHRDDGERHLGPAEFYRLQTSLLARRINSVPAAPDARNARGPT
jgi:hypothetical protein